MPIGKKDLAVTGCGWQTGARGRKCCRGGWGCTKGFHGVAANVDMQAYLP